MGLHLQRTVVFSESLLGTSVVLSKKIAGNSWEANWSSEGWHIRKKNVCVCKVVCFFFFSMRTFAKQIPNTTWFLPATFAHVENQAFAQLFWHKFLCVIVACFGCLVFLLTPWRNQSWFDNSLPLVYQHQCPGVRLVFDPSLKHPSVTYWGDGMGY